MKGWRIQPLGWFVLILLVGVAVYHLAAQFRRKRAGEA